MLRFSLLFALLKITLTYNLQSNGPTLLRPQVQLVEPPSFFGYDLKLGQDVNNKFR